MATTERTLVLSRRFQRVHVPGADDGFRVVLEVVEALGVDREVFAYLELPRRPGEAEARGYFSHVCSSVDLEEYPVGRAHAWASPPWYRSALVDVTLRSRAQVTEFVAAVADDLRNLLLSLGRQDDLAPPETIVISTVPDPSLPASSSAEG